MQHLLATLMLTVAGLMVGMEVCVALFVNPIFDRLPSDDGLLGRADGARVLGKVMPFWYSSSIILSVVFAFVADSGAIWALVSGAALFVVSIVLSIVFLVPINNRAKEWATTAAPPDWRDQLHSWDRFHYVRITVIAAGFVLLAYGTTRG